MRFSVSVAQRGLNLTLFGEHFSGDVVQPIVEGAASFAFDRMYSNAPWRKGYLAQSIQKQVGEGTATIKPLASYAIFVVQGTAPHLIRPVNASCLAFESGMLGGMIFTRLVHHPGTKPNPFVQRSADETVEAMPELAQQVIDEAVGKATEA